MVLKKIGRTERPAEVVSVPFGNGWDAGGKRFSGAKTEALPADKPKRPVPPVITRQANGAPYVRAKLVLDPGRSWLRSIQSLTMRRASMKPSVTISRTIRIEMP